MSDLLEKAIQRAVYRELGGKIYETMAQIEPMNMGQPLRELRLPLVAETHVILERWNPVLTFRTHGYTRDDKQVMGWNQVFSNAELNRGDIVALMQYTMEKSAHMAAHEILKGFPTK